LVGLRDFVFDGGDALGLLSVTGDDVDEIGGGEDSAPACGADRELHVRMRVKRGGTVVITMMVGLKTSSVMVKRERPR
jgi:hypothetical protein